MHPLDNVIWQALTTRQAGFAESSDLARRFVPEVSSLAAFRDPSAESYDALATLQSEKETIRLFLDAPFQNYRGWNLLATAPLLQMVWENGDLVPKAGSDGETEIVELNATHATEMVELAELTKPGPFDKRTHELGTYQGIFRDGKLLAMAGERLKVPGYTEVSAVCTHPEHTGHGYARVLMTEVMLRIRQSGETPFLHVRKNNERAIELYRRLGFSKRKVSHLAVLQKNGS
jgi:ribosomal protein S18 acetylase RimI-like enzyme